MFFTLLTWVAGASAFVFLTLCLACGLFYVSEIVEEYTVQTKRFIKLMTVVSCILVLCMHLG
jgi:hypothetical protein